MLPPSHVAYSWLALSITQERLDVAQDADYRLVALAALGSDLIDKPLALAYFYKKYKSAVLFAHTWWVYAMAFVGHGLLDRVWLFRDTFWWPFLGWRFTVWGKQGAQQEKISQAYWVTFTRRPELWSWEVGGLVALLWFVWRHRLYRVDNLRRFILTGRVGWVVDWLGDRVACKDDGVDGVDGVDEVDELRENVAVEDDR